MVRLRPLPPQTKGKRDTIVDWTDIGLEPAGQVLQTLVAPRQRVLALSLSLSVASGLTVERLYLRHFEEVRYAEIVPLSSTETQRDPVICGRISSLIFLSTEYKARKDRGWSADGADLWRVDLTSRERKIVIRDRDIIAPRQYSRAFLRELLDISSNGRKGTAILGLLRDGIKGSIVEHAVCSLAFDSRACTTLVTLPNVFA